MANSSSSSPQKRRTILVAALVVAVIAAGLASASQLIQRQNKVLGIQFEPEITSGMVVYRYKFGGQVWTHYLDKVVSVTLYLRPGAEEPFDQVVFNLDNGRDRDYVLNADMLVDYQIPPAAEYEQFEKPNQMYNHYDPYLQGYKQDLHEIWVDEQYVEWAGRPATDAEWLEALNDLTRGVEHHQMGRWIKYSPPACRYYIENRLPEVVGRALTAEEEAHIYELLQQGAEYEDIEDKIY